MLRRIGSFETNEAGEPALAIQDLEPRSTFIICQDQEVPALRAMQSREAIAEWIDRCLFGDLRTLILGIDRYFELLAVAQPRPIGGCNFLLAAGCFMALEYLAKVYGRGVDATSAARRYTIDFLGKVDARYVEVFDLLWSCFRNGIVHASWPQAVGIREDVDSRVMTGANPCLAGEHLEADPSHPKPNFVISSRRLFVDLERSYDDFFRDWLLNRSDNAVLDRAGPRLLELSPRDVARVRQLSTIRRWSDASAADE